MTELSKIPTSLQDGVSNRAIEFGKWLQGSTSFKPTNNNNEWKALHMGDGWQTKTTEELYRDFCEEHGY